MLISATAGYFSIVGIAEIFSASYIPAIIMGTGIEAGKLSSIAWLHANWKNNINALHKAYMIIAVAITMIITSLGIYGYLSKAHIDQNIPTISNKTNLKIDEQILEDKKKQLSIIEEKISRINNQLDIQQRNSMITERRSLENQAIKIRKEIDEIYERLRDNNHVLEANNIKLGPIKYISDIFFDNGGEDKALKIFMLALVLVFDPLAATLLMAFLVSYKQRMIMNKDVTYNEHDDNICDNKKIAEKEQENAEPTPRKLKKKPKIGWLS